MNADGSLACYKAHVVANSRSECPDVDCDDTFSHVVKPATIHIVLIISVTHNKGIFDNLMSRLFFFTGIFWTVFTCINYRVLGTLPDRIMFVYYINLYMSSNRHHTLGFIALLRLSPNLVLFTARATHLCVFIDKALIFPISFYM